MEYTRLPGECAEEHANRLVALLRERDAELERLRGGSFGDGGYVACTEPMVSQVGENVVVGQGIEEAEAMLEARSKEGQSPMVLELLKSLQSCAVYTDTPNHETNRKLWDAYAQGWGSDKDWVQRMAGHLPGPQERQLEFVGDEWSDESSLQAVLAEWLQPLVTAESTCAEVGSGGGRIAARIAGKVRRLVCFDVSSQMLAAAKRRLVDELGNKNVDFQQVSGETLYPAQHHGIFDVVYSFDVFVHLDLHQMRQTLCSIRALLRPGGQCFLSFANLLAPAGWQRFARQKRYSVGGFYFVSPDIVRCLVRRSGLELLRVSEVQEGNTYLNRDLLVIAQRPFDGNA
eukprot:TRINITY_DN104132_c0_g1_i1.p1 TRINITY_DN104132_c0_g1~~TRINITY_DN104132_c0_g1_i1.p1  ORF type:complete len:344 (-),score=72.98 TRINITY_DN104132_c0_g1_i1:563-1594(-)